MNIPNPIPTLRQRLLNIESLLRELSDTRDLRLYDETRKAQLAHSNPLNAFGKKCFSQTDEDGITIEILRRIGCLDNGTYAEYGVGDGTENNTLILAALGWRGFWVGGETLRPDINDGRGSNFQYAKEWITLDNIHDISSQCLQRLERKTIDVISLDLDGNDIHFMRSLLKVGHRPKLLIVEYNAKFPPPVEFEIAYDPKHVWQGDDYFGASLTSFVKEFHKFDYQLVCCNSHTGSNAFFVDSAYANYFKDVPPDLDSIYVGPRYALYTKFGHPASIDTIERIFDLL
ncbi:hypothetical protein KBZ20_16770 [Vulcanococcus limneticus Candia 3F8]|uniref:hypothetical protein n=1 Tax=Vulcanococcus limneticus TaxID=2170428 RepID=UPI0018E322A1|nr:hypothetical protein [Vulcanococcus limneticus]MCP9792178.1 hypothetical protein [Vulcanococcus limneticus MW73D5]MCP9895418.1 hypothetical protein [Vulcanococcus limneticus Candia 3F8]MCP9897631.1 hypothetical protein [Vulcanococcus limneticus Candia 3B3]